MKKIFPNYYEKFSCIADKCPFTCCQEWKIAVDEDTLKKWQKLSPPNMGSFSDYVCLNMGSEAVKLNEDKKCPFLTENKLCSIVLKYGEDTISNTCRTFPKISREYANKTELNLDCGCPWALELLLNEESFSLVGEKYSETDIDALGNGDFEDIYFFVRDFLMEIISDEKHSVRDALKISFYILNELFESDDESYSDKEAIEEYVKVLSRVCQESFVGELDVVLKEHGIECMKDYSEYNELFLDIADNYNKKGMYANILGDIYDKALILEGKDISDEYVQFLGSGFYDESMLRRIIQEEIFSTLYMPEGDVYSMLLKLQWIILVYALITHCLFLKWSVGDLDHAMEIKVISLILRMTGYGEDDIEEYLVNSFESAIWNWGYVSLIL